MAEFMTQLEAIEQVYRLHSRPARRLTCRPHWFTLFAHTKQIRLAARQLSKLHLSLCNGVIGADGFAKWDEADQANYESKCGKAETAALAAFKALFPRNLWLHWQRDPHGPSIVVYDGADVDGQNRLASFW